MVRNGIDGDRRCAAIVDRGGCLAQRYADDNHTTGSAASATATFQLHAQPPTASPGTTGTGKRRYSPADVGKAGITALLGRQASLHQQADGAAGFGSQLQPSSGHGVELAGQWRVDRRHGAAAQRLGQCPQPIGSGLPRLWADDQQRIGRDPQRDRCRRVKTLIPLSAAVRSVGQVDHGQRAGGGGRMPQNAGCSGQCQQGSAAPLAGIDPLNQSARSDPALGQQSVQRGAAGRVDLGSVR